MQPHLSVMHFEYPVAQLADSNASPLGSPGCWTWFHVPRGQRPKHHLHVPGSASCILIDCFKKPRNPVCQFVRSLRYSLHLQGFIHKWCRISAINCSFVSLWSNTFKVSLWHTWLGLWSYAEPWPWLLHQRYRGYLCRTSFGPSLHWVARASMAFFTCFATMSANFRGPGVRQNPATSILDANGCHFLFVMWAVVIIYSIHSIHWACRLGTPLFLSVWHSWRVSSLQHVIFCLLWYHPFVHGDSEKEFCEK